MDIASHTLLSIIATQVRLVSLRNDLSAVMDLASGAAAELTGADGAVVELLEDEDIVYRSACGIAEYQLGLRMPVANSLSGYCLTNRVSEICTDSETDERVNREACRKVGLRSMVIVPLIAAERAVAVMKLVWAAPHVFDKNESEIAQLLANMTAMLMQLSADEGPNVLRQRLTLDETTGTANRSHFFEQLQAKLVVAQGGKAHVAVAVIRVSGLDALFSQSNPELASIIVETSRRIERECRAGDIVARIAIDEFAVILSSASRRSIVTSQIHRISRAIASEPLTALSETKSQLVLQAGAAMYPEDGNSAASLVLGARVALGTECPNIELGSRR